MEESIYENPMETTTTTTSTTSTTSTTVSNANNMMKNLPEPVQNGLKSFQQSMVDFSANLYILLQCLIITCSVPKFYLNFSLTEFNSLVSDKLANSRNPNVSSKGVYACLIFLVHLAYVVVTTVFFEFLFLAMKWVLIWGGGTLLLSGAQMVMQKIKSE
jgi:hypothetical protein